MGDETPDWRGVMEGDKGMTAMAAACGVLIVVLGVWSTGRNPTEAQSAVEIVCLVGGLILCFLAVVLSRLGRIATQLDTFEAVAGESPEAVPDDGPGPLAR